MPVALVTGCGCRFITNLHYDVTDEDIKVLPANPMLPILPASARFPVLDNPMLPILFMFLERFLSLFTAFYPSLLAWPVCLSLSSEFCVDTFKVCASFHPSLWRTTKCYHSHAC